MVRFVLCAYSMMCFATLAPNVMAAPAVLYLMDRWMIKEAENYERDEDIALFTKTTMIAPMVSIWVLFIWCLLNR